jgi:DNA-directed RNA polymerase subunit M/transcription elongation factor TFIIS
MELRDHVRDELKKNLPDNLAAALECAILRYSLDSCRESLTLPTWDHEEVQEAYVRKAKMLIHNILHPACKLKDELIAGGITVSEACLRTHQELRPDIWSQLEEQRKADEEESASQATRESDLPCNNCARKGLPCYNTEYREFQTRAGDESTTIYAFCRTCQKRWKFSG